MCCRLFLATGRSHPGVADVAPWVVEALDGVARFAHTTASMTSAYPRHGFIPGFVSIIILHLSLLGSSRLRLSHDCAFVRNAEAGTTIIGDFILFRIETRVLREPYFALAATMCLSSDTSTPGWVHGILLDQPNLLPVSSILKQGPSIDMMWYEWEDEATGVKNKRSMLQLAAATQAVKCVQLLLDAGADARLASPSDGQTALHLACNCKPSMSSARVIAMLVQHGADRDALDFNGQAPGHKLQRISTLSACPASSLSLPLRPVSPASSNAGNSDMVTSGPQRERQHSARSCNHCHHSRLASNSKSALVTNVADLELMDGVDYGSSHFRMFHYKVDVCPHEDCIHDTDACPYVHPGDKSRRRNPSVVMYQPVPCPHFRKGNCRLGDACPLSHGVFECWLHPNKYRTQLCTEGTGCSRELCFFAHSLDELREPFEDCNTCSLPLCKAGSADSNTPRSVCGNAGGTGFNSSMSSPEISQGSISSLSAHENPCTDRKIASLQSTAIDRERTRREAAVAAIAETLKSMAASRNVALQVPTQQTAGTAEGRTLYKRTGVQDTTSVLSIPRSDSSVSETIGSSDEYLSAFP